jgi:hypothetical protein
MMKRSVLALMVACPLAATAAEKPAKPVRNYECPHTGTVTEIALSPDERYVVQAEVSVREEPSGEMSYSENVRLYEREKHCVGARMRPDAGLKSPRLPRSVTQLAFSGEGRLLVASADTLRAVRVPGMQQLWEQKIEAADHPTAIRMLAVARDAPVAAVIAVPLPSAASTPNDEPKLVRRPSFRALFRAYALDTGKTLSEFDVGRDWLVRSLALAPDGKRAVLVVRPRQQQKGAEPDLMVVNNATGRIEKVWHAEAAGPLAFATNTSVRLLVWGKEMRSVVREFDIERGGTVRDLPLAESMAASALAGSAGGRWFAAPLFTRSHVLLGELLLSAEHLKPDEIAIYDGASGAAVAATREASSSRLLLSRSGRLVIAGTRIFEFDLPPAP